MLKHVRGRQGFLANLLQYFFEFGYGKIWYAPKLAMTLIPYTLLYYPVLTADLIFKTVLTFPDNALDCFLLGNCNGRHWFV